jgi:predicted nucleotidyltransferase
MDSDKLGDKSTIGILDLTCVNHANHTVTLNKNSEMYRNMSQQNFNKQVKEQTGTARLKVAMYIARTIQAFVKDDKTLIKISYFLNKFNYDSLVIPKETPSRPSISKTANNG